MKKYVIGVDGGGTKTTVALADLEGRILTQVEVGPSNLRNVGLERAVANIGKGIKKLTSSFAEATEDKKAEVIVCFIGLAAMEEENRAWKEEIKERLFGVLKGKVVIGSDQLVAFRSGTDKKDGAVLISGTGAVCHGWWRGKEAKASGWGWLDDEGSGFWVGQRAFRALFKHLDGRGPETLLKDLIFEQMEVENKEELMVRIYQGQNLVRTVSLMSIAADEAAQKGDKVAREIFKEAGRELILSCGAAIESLGIRDEEFPLVLVGKMFNSQIILSEVKGGIGKIAPEAKIIRLDNDPVGGAVKLAIEQL